MLLSALGSVAVRFGVNAGRGCGTFGTPDEEGGPPGRIARSPFKSFELCNISTEMQVSIPFSTNKSYLFDLLFPENHFLNPLGSFLVCVDIIDGTFQWLQYSNIPVHFPLALPAECY